MRQRLIPLFTTWPFLLALALLMANDLWMKAAWPGIVTGKLSDFAGIAVVGMLLSAVWPKRGVAIFIGVSAFFLWWKSPASGPFIAWWNTLGVLRIGRVVDFTDLSALSVLPLCHVFAARVTSAGIAWPRVRRWLTVPVVGLTLAGLLATSSRPTFYEYVVRKQAAGEVLPRGTVADVVTVMAERKGLVCGDCSRRTERGSYTGKLHVDYEFVGDGAVRFRLTGQQGGLFSNDNPEQLALSMRTELKYELARRIPGLEYVEDLESNHDIGGQPRVKPSPPAAPASAASRAPAGSSPAR